MTLAALVGCSDDDSPNVIPDVPDAAVDAGPVGPVDNTTGATGGSGDESSTTTTPTTSSEGPDTLTVDPGTGESGSTVPSSGPVDPTSSPTGTGGNLSSEVPTDGTGVIDPTGGDPTTDVIIDTTGAQSTGDTSDLPPNLVANWDFEVDTAGWYSWGSGVTLTTSAEKANTGNQSLLVSGGTTFGPAATQIAAEAGATYEVTFWASAAAGSGQIHIVRSLECLPADAGRYQWVVGNTDITSNEFTELTGTFTIPADCNSTTFQVYVEGSTALNVHLDTVSVRLISHGGVDTGGDTSGVDETTGPDDTTGAVETTGIETSDVPTSDVEPTTDLDAGVVETTDDTPVDPDASVGDTSAPENDASVTSAPIDTSVAPETSAPADTTVVDETSAPVDPYGPNVHTNSGFESGTDWWYNTGGGTIERSTTYAHSGTYSLLKTGRTATWNGAGTNLLSDGISPDIIPGATYLIQAWVRLEGLATGTVAFSGTFICDGTQTQPWLANAAANDTGWTLVSGEFTVPSCGGTGLTDFTLIVNNPAIEANIYLDDFSLRQVLN